MTRNEYQRNPGSTQAFYKKMLVSVDLFFDSGQSSREQQSSAILHRSSEMNCTSTRKVQAIDLSHHEPSLPELCSSVFLQAKALARARNALWSYALARRIVHGISRPMMHEILDLTAA